MRILIALTFLTTVLALALMVAPPSHAQGVEGLEPIDIEKSVFPETKQGCTKKALFRVAIANMYKKGKDPDELANMQIMKPLVQNAYEEIGRSGLTDYNLKTVKDYQNCGQQAKADSSVRKEEKYTAIYKACSAVNDLTLTALDAAVKKRSRDATVKSLEKRKLDLAGTFLEKMKDPALYLAEQVFVKHEQSYDDAVEFVAQMSTNCLYGKDD